MEEYEDILKVTRNYFRGCFSSPQSYSDTEELRDPRLVVDKILRVVESL